MKNTQSPGRRRPGGAGRRLVISLAVGAAAGLALAVQNYAGNHAALAATAANGHTTTGSILASGGIFTALVVALVVFVIATLRARRRSARAAAMRASYPPARPRRRSRAGAWR